MSDARYQVGDSLLTLFCQRVEVKGRYRVLTGMLTSWVYDVFPVDNTGVRFPDLKFWGVPEFQLIAMDEYDSEVAHRQIGTSSVELREPRSREPWTREHAGSGGGE